MNSLLSRKRGQAHFPQVRRKILLSPFWFSLPFWVFLPVELHGELQNPRVAGGRDRAECRRAQIRARVVQVHVVNGVEGFESCLHPIALGDGEEPAQTYVDAEIAGAAQRVASDVARGAGGVLDERGPQRQD